MENNKPKKEISGMYVSYSDIALLGRGRNSSGTFAPGRVLRVVTKEDLLNKTYKITTVEGHDFSPVTAEDDGEGYLLTGNVRPGTTPPVLQAVTQEDIDGLERKTILDHLNALCSVRLAVTVEWHYVKAKKTAWLQSANISDLHNLEEFLREAGMETEMGLTKKDHQPILLINNFSLNKLEALTTKEYKQALNRR
jgi:hypothetical protein